MSEMSSASLQTGERKDLRNSDSVEEAFSSRDGGELTRRQSTLLIGFLKSSSASKAAKMQYALKLEIDNKSRHCPHKTRETKHSI
jgi:hypothetical protein